MAYSDYGAFVYLNGERRFDKENVAGFASDEETFGCDSSNIPSGARIFQSLIHQHESGANRSWVENIHHGVMSDGNVRVICYKQGLPEIYEATEEGIKEIKFCDDDIDYFDYGTVIFDYKDYHFVFESGKPYYAEMIEPNGDKWVCEYDYMYGAGFEEI